MRPPTRLNRHAHRNAADIAATGNDLHDAYVHAVNAALSDGREHVARELAADYDTDRGVVVHEERQAA